MINKDDFTLLYFTLNIDKDLSFHKVYDAEKCLQPSEFIAQSPKSTLC